MNKDQINNMNNELARRHMDREIRFRDTLYRTVRTMKLGEKMCILMDDGQQIIITKEEHNHSNGNTPKVMFIDDLSPTK